MSARTFQETIETERGPDSSVVTEVEDEDEESSSSSSSPAAAVTQPSNTRSTHVKRGSVSFVLPVDVVLLDFRLFLLLLLGFFFIPSNHALKNQSKRRNCFPLGVESCCWNTLSSALTTKHFAPLSRDVGATISRQNG